MRTWSARVALGTGTGTALLVALALGIVLAPFVGHRVDADTDHRLGPGHAHVASATGRGTCALTPGQSFRLDTPSRKGTAWSLAAAQACLVPGRLVDVPEGSDDAGGDGAVLRCTADVRVIGSPGWLLLLPAQGSLGTLVAGVLLVVGGRALDDRRGRAGRSGRFGRSGRLGRSGRGAPPARRP